MLKKTEIHPDEIHTLFWSHKDTFAGDIGYWECGKCYNTVRKPMEGPTDVPKGKCPHCGVEWFFVETQMHVHMNKKAGEGCQICRKARG